MLPLLMWAASSRAATLEQLTANPVDLLLADRDTPSQFRIVALSNAAEACVGRYRRSLMAKTDAETCLSNLARAALDERLSPYGAPVSSVQDLGEHGLFLTHLAIVLGARDEIARGSCDEPLHHRIVEHLAAASLAHPSGIGRSYPSTPARWPADQAATSYALWLYDHTHNASLSKAPVERYLASIPAAGLPASEITGTKTDGNLPRGSALAYTVRYLAPVAPQAARSLWTRIESEGFLVKVGPFAALREWAQGVQRPADVDSGPIINGFGTSATAFGRAAARSLGDKSASALDRTAAFGLKFAVNNPEVSAASKSLLAVAISAQTEIAAPRGASGP